MVGFFKFTFKNSVFGKGVFQKKTFFESLHWASQGLSKTHHEFTCVLAPRNGPGVEQSDPDPALPGSWVDGGTELEGTITSFITLLLQARVSGLCPGSYNQVVTPWWVEHSVMTSNAQHQHPQKRVSPYRPGARTPQVLRTGQLPDPLSYNPVPTSPESPWSFRFTITFAALSLWDANLVNLLWFWFAF